MHNELGLSKKEFDFAVKLSSIEVFADATPQNNPTGIVLGGQPASGKSLLIRRIRDSQPDKSFVVINGDDLRQFHPRFNEYNNLDDREAAKLTQALANALGQILLKKSIEQKYNIIIEGTMRNPAVPRGTIQRFKQAAYITEAHVLAVHYHLSQQAIYERYEYQKASGQAGRFSPLNIHEEAYNGLLTSIDNVYSDKIVDYIAIYNRGAKDLLAEYFCRANQWSDITRPSEVIKIERDRKLTSEEQVACAICWEEIIAARQAREADIDLLPETAYKKALEHIFETPEEYQLYLRRSSQ